MGSLLRSAPARGPAALAVLSVFVILVLVGTYVGPGGRTPDPGAGRLHFDRVPHAAPRPAGDTGSAAQWKNISQPGAAPGGRNRAVFVFDPGGRYALLFGGYDPGGLGWLGDTWMLQGTTWKETSPGTSPGPRSSAASAYDPYESGVVLFGGYNYFGAPPYANDTWLFSNGSWTNLSGPIGPSARSESAMAFDPALHELVLFGGTDGSDCFNDTWVFASGTWSRLSTTVAPPQLSGGVMAYDANTSSLVLYGGQNGSKFSLGTWSFNGTWTELPSADSPGGQYLPMMTALPNGTLLLGGLPNPSSSSIGLWELDSQGWIPVGAPGAPSSRSASGFTYDASLGYPVLFGGRADVGGVVGPALNDTWAFDTLDGRVLPESSHGLAPFEVNFSANVVGGSFGANGMSSVSYLWSLGDGTTSTARSPTHTYLLTGVMPIEVVVRDGFDLELSLGVNVTVGFGLSIVATPGPNSSLSYQFTASAPHAANPLTCQWSFGDGTPVDFEASPIHNFSTAGEYTVELQAKDGDGVVEWANASISPSGPTGGMPRMNPGGSSSSFSPLELYSAVAGGGAVVVALAALVGWRRRSRPPIRP